MGDGLQQRFHGGAREGFGESLGQFGPADQLHGVGRQLFTGVEEGAQHIPGGPAAAYRCGFVTFSVDCEGSPHRVLGYVNYIHACGIVVGDQTGDGQEILSVSLHGVRRGFAGLAVVQERGEPFRERIGLGGAGIRAGNDRRVCGFTAIGHPYMLPAKDG